jgi:dehydrogenase/reductase SDR family protein 1
VFVPVALVTGASRGVGKGVVAALAAAGWQVYFTGRSTSAGGTTVPLPGTIEETAAATGGIGLACDHRDDGASRAVVERIQAEVGRLDLLVNNAWSGYEYLHRGEYEFAGAAAWERPLSIWDDMLGSVRIQYAVSVLAAPLLIATGAGLIVNVSSSAAVESTGDAAYGVAKAAADRLTGELARELLGHRVAVVSLHPGLVRTESVLASGDYFDLTGSQSPDDVGRAIALLAADARILQRTGKALAVAAILAG